MALLGAIGPGHHGLLARDGLIGGPWAYGGLWGPWAMPWAAIYGYVGSIGGYRGQI
jgi:hypothetical protein